MNGEFDHGVFQGKVMAKLDSIHEDVKSNKKLIAHNEKRIRVLENWRWYRAGGIALGTSLPQLVKAVL